MDPLMRGVVNLVVVTAGLAGSVGAILYAAEIRRALRHARERISPPPPQPEGQPLAELVADLRRLHCAYRHHPAGQPMQRRRGIEQAYDDVLLDTARALGLPDTLSDLPPGTERDAERMRVEYLIEEQGVPLRLPS